MGNRAITLRGRIFQTAAEMVIGIASAVFFSFLMVYFLYGNRIISSISIKEELDYDLIRKDPYVADYLNQFKVNYVIFDGYGKIKQKYISESNLIIVKECFHNQKNLKASSGEYLFFEGAEVSIVIRVPYVPEFADIELEEKYHFNLLFNNAVLFLCFLMASIPVIRFLQQTKNEFLELEKSILEDAKSETRVGKPPRIIEIQKSIDQVSAMKKTLFDLIEREKGQKKDLLFQTSALSHDIKTPLTVIKGNVWLFEHCDSENEKKECIKCINSGIESIEDYLDQMISYAKLSYYPEEKREIRIKDLVDGILNGVEGYRAEVKLEVIYNFKDETVYCSKSSVQRAVVNMLINAYNHAKNRVSFQIAFKECLVFKIYNDGDHLGEEMIENIGKLFFTGDKGRNNKDKHYGIGLYFAKNVALNHGGDLSCENLADGVEFTLEIMSSKP